ncbi:MAG: T9SS type A sorting domain-containing protein [Lewinellaceae bacterium]|nr:T9SS type A sorting domain-containing protein [Lewinellaceae bacterium]
MSIKKIIVLVCVCLTTQIRAQQTTTHQCGVSIEDQLEMERLYPNDTHKPFNRQDVVYVPIKFHLTANTDGTGRINDYYVLNQLCTLNTDYDSSGIQFYIANGFNYLNNTNIFSSPASYNSQIVLKKDAKALNVFITENAETSSSTIGTVQGYYSSQGDYVIVRKEELIKGNNTLSHEIGHFFSLRHTFYGWENVPYDKNIHGDTIKFLHAPGITNILVEVMNKSNCADAADNICDTPPDYNFGLTASSCLFNTAVYDINREKVVPMIKNQMGYFNYCDEYFFTDGQSERMRNNFLSSGRSHLRVNYTPNTMYIEDAPVVISPTQGSTVATYDHVEIAWDIVQGASMYLIEIRGSGFYYSDIVTNPNIVLTNLKKSSLYNATIRPFNEGFTCSTSKSLTFRTGTSMYVGTSDEWAKEVEMVLMPNPVEKGTNLMVKLGVQGFTLQSISVINSTGQIVEFESKPFDNGNQNFVVNTSSLTSGFYILRAKVGDRIVSSKFSIQ